MPTVQEQFAPTIRAQLLGARMRELREERGLAPDYVATYLRMESSALARYERAEWPFRRDHVTALLDVYKVRRPERQALVALAQEARCLHQWEQDDALSPPSPTVVDHWWLQERAEELHIYAATHIPPLLWTPDTAEAVIRGTSGSRSLRSSTVDSVVRQCLGRQQILDHKPPTRLVFYLEEHLLQRPVGGCSALRRQLEHLVRAAEERPHVQIRVVPPAGRHQEPHGSFTLCLMRRPYPPVALVEHLGGRLALEAQAAEAYRQACERVGEVARNQDESINLIAKTAKQLA